jgi:hypothetical protein
VDGNQGVAEGVFLRVRKLSGMKGLQMGVEREMWGRVRKCFGMREGRKGRSTEIRIGEVSSQRRVALVWVLVNNDLLRGNSNVGSGGSKVGRGGSNGECR